MYKVLIVDDEPLLRSAIKRLIDWENYGFTVCGEAADGNSALQQLKDEAPDLMLTDIVIPGMDGLELLKNAKLRFPKMKVIMLSSYDEFRYVQKALQFGAADYILKPMLEAGKMLLLLKQLFPPLKKSGTEPGRPILDFTNVKLRAFAVILTKDMSPHAKIEILASFTSRLKDIKIHRLPQPNAEIFLMEKDAAPRAAEEFLRNSGVTGMVINHISSSEELLELLQNLTYLKDFPFFMPHCHVLITEPSELLPFRAACIPVQNPDALLSLSGFLLLLQNVSLRDRIAPRHLKLNAETILFDYFAKTEETEENLPFFERITFSENIVELREAFGFFYTRIMEGLKGKNRGRSLMEQISRFVEANYQKNITLKDTADFLHFNYSYLSHCFNTQSAVNFKEYLNNVRVENAKRLLEEGSLSIACVCFRTGFTDHAYFSRVFRKVTGLTPTDYKKSASKLE